MIFAAVEGRGTLEVGGAKFDLAPHDVAVVPGWMAYTLRASEDWVVFSFSDRSAQEKLGFFRDERL
jgi:gentisate 1,2-dioxygenase